MDDLCGAGMDVNIDFRHSDASKKFCNKIWQSTKYVLGNIGNDENIPRFDTKKYTGKKIAPGGQVDLVPPQQARQASHRPQRAA